jgi:hypothetical protein
VSAFSLKKHDLDFRGRSFEAGRWLSVLARPPVSCLSAAETFLEANLRFFCTFAAARSVVSQPL